MLSPIFVSQRWGPRDGVACGQLWSPQAVLVRHRLASWPMPEKKMQRRLVGVISLHAHSLCTLLTGLPAARFCMCVRRYRGLAREAQ